MVIIIIINKIQDRISIVKNRVKKVNLKKAIILKLMVMLKTIILIIITMKKKNLKLLKKAKQVK